MLFETGLIIAVIAAGKFADTYSTLRVKRIAALWLRQADRFDWHAFVAQRSWLIYTKLFGQHGASWRFIKRSLASYVVIVLLSLVFLWSLFPSTYHSIMSVWTYGTNIERIWWTACVLLGGAMYVLANAQTLYFLEILKGAPSFFKFVLVAYADFLITASISLFGVPALLTLYTVGVSATSTELLQLDVDFTRMRDDEASRILNRLEGGGSTPPARASAGDPPGSLTVSFRFSDPRDDLRAANADYDEVLAALRRGHVGAGVELGSDGSILFRTFDTFIALIVRGRPYEGTVTSFAQSSGSAPVRVDRFCRRFAEGALGLSEGYVRSPRMQDVALSLFHACKSETRTSVQIPTRINVSGLDISRVYRTYLLIALSDMTFAVSSGFQSYLVISPYSVIRMEDPAQVWNVYATLQGMGGTGRAYDHMLAEAYFRKVGVGRAIMHSGLPAGTINFAIMSTALFNVLVMSVFFILFPLVHIFSRYEVISRVITLNASPFTIIATVVAVWLGVLWAIVQLI